MTEDLDRQCSIHCPKCRTRLILIPTKDGPYQRVVTFCPSCRCDVEPGKATNYQPPKKMRVWSDKRREVFRAKHYAAKALLRESNGGMQER